jgi:hypothetical protein
MMCSCKIIKHYIESNSALYVKNPTVLVMSWHSKSSIGQNLSLALEFG